MNITSIIISLIGLCFAVLTCAIVPTLKAKYGQERINAMLQWVSIGVRTAEQLYSKNDGSAKRQYVIDFLNSKGYTIEKDKIDIVLEAYVHELHTALKG